MFVTKKKVNGKDYYYLQKSIREGDKIKSECVAYLGKDKEDADKKAAEIIERMEKEEWKVKEEDNENEDKNVKITYFVHGTTIDNEKGISTGQNQGELSELGIKQSKELSKQIGNKEFDVVFCSDLKRAIDSAEISFNNYKIIQDKRLRECNYGDLNGAKEDKIEYSKHINDKFPNGESLKDVEKRIKEFLDFLKEEYSGKYIAIVAHKAPQLAIEVLLKNKTWEEAIKPDWRKKGKWQPGWDYEIKANKEEGIKKENKNVLSIEEKASSTLSVEELTTFCKRKGFVYPSAEIYGGLAGFWDFGPLGVELKNNLKKEWWKYHVYQREDIAGIDGSIITNPQVWKASGHADNFTDVYVKCKKCKKPSKIDKKDIGKVKCECNGEYEVIGDFNLMFKTNVGPVETENSLAYLRPETAQLIFADFKFVQENSRLKLPFGIAQIGKSFRNEISPRDFLFRCREFEQMEIEYFIHPEKRKECPYFSELDNFELNIYSEEMQKSNKASVKMKVKNAVEKGIIKLKWHGYWLANETKWFLELGADKNKFRVRQHLREERSHYATDTWDLQYKFPFGWQELEGIADRGNFDLSQHEKFSKEDLKIFDEETKTKVLPHVVCEPSLGVERAFLVFMFDAYNFDEKRQNIVLKLNPKLAPIKAAVFPIIKQPEYNKIAEDMVRDLRKEFNVVYDKSGSIGRRYARNDEAGTPYCITIDEDSLKDNDCTIRDRNTTLQIRVKIKELREILRKLINREIEFRKAGKIVETRVKEKNK